MSKNPFTKVAACLAQRPAMPQMPGSPEAAAEITSLPTPEIPSPYLHSPQCESDGGEGFAASDSFGTGGVRLQDLLDRRALRLLLETLTLREEQILVMRFHRKMTQSEIGLELNVSQMQVSRMLSAILSKLRAQETS